MPPAPPNTSAIEAHSGGGTGAVSQTHPGHYTDVRTTAGPRSGRGVVYGARASPDAGENTCAETPPDADQSPSPLP